MADRNALVPLPTQPERFHRQRFVDYQLNRALGLGFAVSGELHTAASHIRTRDDCVRVFDELSRRAEAEGRTRNAMSYGRVAEFFSPFNDAERRRRYRRHRRLFDAGFSEDGPTRHDVAYSGGWLPVYRLPAWDRSRGTVLLHGGFDSLIEEFFVVWQRMAAAGFDVLAFDGPGQGGARRLSDLTFEHDWERPVGVILDHFNISSAGLVGMSMGGYWALRAAGREQRIERVVAWPAVFDWLERIPSTLRRPTRAMLRQQRLMRWSVRVRARLVPTLRLIVGQALYNLGSDDPYDVVAWFAGMNPNHLGSGRVTQDVLLLCGEHDRFQPPALTQAQATALHAAHSVTVRTFTADEHADQHCQMGNLALACDVVTRWLQSPEPAVGRPNELHRRDE